MSKTKRAPKSAESRLRLKIRNLKKQNLEFAHQIDQQNRSLQDAKEFADKQNAELAVKRLAENKPTASVSLKRSIDEVKTLAIERITAFREAEDKYLYEQSNLQQFIQAHPGVIEYKPSLK